MLPANSSDSVVWNSSNEAVATVVDGRVRAVSAGSAKITAKAGNVSTSCTLKVIAEDTALWNLYTIESKVGTKSDSAPAFKNGSIELKANNAIVLNEAYTSGIVKVQFDVSYDTYYADRGATKVYASGNRGDTEPIYGGTTKSEGYETQVQIGAGTFGKLVCGILDGTATEYTAESYASFVSASGVSKGTKVWSAGGSSNGWNTVPANLLTLTATQGDTISDSMISKNESAGETVTYTIQYDLSKNSESANVALSGTISDGTLTDTKTLKGSDMRWGNASNATVATSIRPYISNGTKNAVTISNIKVYVDNEEVTTTASLTLSD